MVAAILALLGLMPGMPHFVILPAAAMAGYAAWRLKKTADRPVQAAARPHLSKAGQAVRRYGYGPGAELWQTAHTFP